MTLGFVLALGGIGVLIPAASLLVRGSARLAVRYKLSPVVVGVVLLGFGTSVPEMVVSGVAAARGDLDLGVGNIVGSNVANMSLVLAAAAAVRVIYVSDRTRRYGVPASVGAVAFFAYLIQGEITRIGGAFFVALMLIFIGIALRFSTANQVLADEVTTIVGSAPLKVRCEVLRAVAGLSVIVVGSWLIVDGAGRIADGLGVSSGFVGFTLVALGTSAPELVTSVQAARQNETGLLIGNLVGSNVFNSFAVGGIIGLVGPGQVSDMTLAGEGSILMITIVVVSAVPMIVLGRVGKREAFVLFFLWLVSLVVLANGSAVEVGVPLR